MRKTLSILLTFIFLTSTVGVTLATHYCGGKLFGSRIVTDIHHDPCGCPESPMDDGCCKDEIVVIKITNDFVSANSFSFAKQVTYHIALPVSAEIINPGNAFSVKAEQYFSSPPLYAHIPLYILSRTFRS